MSRSSLAFSFRENAFLLTGVLAAVGEDAIEQSSDPRLCAWLTGLCGVLFSNDGKGSSSSYSNSSLGSSEEYDGVEKYESREPIDWVYSGDEGAVEGIDG